LSAASRRMPPDCRRCARPPMLALLTWRAPRSPTSMKLAHCKAICYARLRTQSLAESGLAERAAAPLSDPIRSVSRTRFRQDRRVDCGDIRDPSGQDIPAYADARARSTFSGAPICQIVSRAMRSVPDFEVFTLLVRDAEDDTSSCTGPPVRSASRSCASNTIQWTSAAMSRSDNVAVDAAASSHFYSNPVATRPSHAAAAPALREVAVMGLWCGLDDGTAPWASVRTQRRTP
jgi:hypothetical protein